MTTHLGEVVSQLQAVINSADQAAVQASRAQADAQAAHVGYAAVGRGSEHPSLRQAVTDARTAAEKLGKVARLLSEGAGAFAQYLNKIAPGRAPSRTSLTNAMPSGEQLVEQRPDRASRLDRWLLSNAEAADDLSDAAAEAGRAAGNAQKAISRYVKGRVDPTAPGSTVTGSLAPEIQAAPVGQPDPADAASAVAVSVIAIAVAGKSVKQFVRKHRKGRNSADEPESE